MIKDYLITISEELYKKLPDYAKNSVFWAYRYTPELKAVSYATICSKETYQILLGVIEYVLEGEKVNERKKEKR